VQPATNSTEQNCVAFQLGGAIYYRTTRQVVSGELLKVWYAGSYARKLGKPALPGSALPEGEMENPSAEQTAGETPSLL